MLLFCRGCGNGLIVGGPALILLCWQHLYNNITCKVTELGVSKAERSGWCAWLSSSLGERRLYSRAMSEFEHPRAYCMQLQTRSADDPMTTFYRRCRAPCGHHWRD
uniref:TFIIS-type domain-containing protein n=1 Tax=Urocitellus parryii TaxID=9999 RepID=A0A8D2IGI6_UROPR